MHLKTWPLKVPFNLKDNFLAVLIFSPERYRKAIRAAGAMPILLSIMQKRDASNSEELTASAEVLAALSRDGLLFFSFSYVGLSHLFSEEAGEVLIQKGSVPLLIGNLTSPVAEVRKASLRALSAAMSSGL